MISTVTDLSALVSSLIEARDYSRSLDPFSFDLQPSANLDFAYYITLTLIGTEGMLGPAEFETYALDFWIARQRRDDPHAIKNEMLDSLRSLRGDCYNAKSSFDVLVGETESDVRLPGPDDTHMVGHLRLDIQIANIFGTICTP